MAQENKQPNTWKIGTIILAIAILFLMGWEWIKADNYYNRWKNDVCEDMSRFGIGTPSWFSSEGILLISGYIPMSNVSFETFEASFINERVYLVKKDNCGWCQKQIEDMKNSNVYNRYEEEGLIITCE